MSDITVQTATRQGGSAAAERSRLIYLDHSATTPLAPQVIRVVARNLGIFGNPSSLHGAGQEARRALSHAREEVAQLLNARPEEIVFTASGSEADNMAIKGSVLGGAGGPCHIITSQIEHAAVLATCRYLETVGHSVTYLPISAGGRVDPDDVRRHLRPNTRLISVMHANNETGVLQPIEEIGAIARETGVLFHSDMVQTVGKVGIDLNQLPVDMVAFSGHKFRGPKGIGGLVVREGVQLDPLIHGGGQEANLRAGTENVLGIIALGAAAELARRTPPAEWDRQRLLRDRLCEGLLAIGDVRVNGDLQYALPGVLNVSFRFIKGDAIATALAFENIAVSTGSACHAHEVKPSHVLVALGLSEEWLFGAIRFSLGHETTTDDIDHVLAVITRVVTRLRAASPLARKGAAGSEPLMARAHRQARIHPSAQSLTAGPYTFVLSRETPEDAQEAVNGHRLETTAAATDDAKVIDGRSVSKSVGARSLVGGAREDGVVAISLAPDAAAAWRQALAVLHDSIPSESGAAISLVEEGELLLFVDAVGPHAEKIRGMRLGRGVGCAGFAIERRMSFLVRDPEYDTRFFPGIDEALAHRTRELLVVPVMQNGEMFGCLEALNPPPDTSFVNADLARAEKIAQTLAERLACQG